MRNSTRNLVVFFALIAGVFMAGCDGEEIPKRESGDLYTVTLAPAKAGVRPTGAAGGMLEGMTNRLVYTNCFRLPSVEEVADFTVSESLSSDLLTVTVTDAKGRTIFQKSASTKELQEVDLSPREFGENMGKRIGVTINLPPKKASPPKAKPTKLPQKGS